MDGFAWCGVTTRCAQEDNIASHDTRIYAYHIIPFMVASLCVLSYLLFYPFTVFPTRAHRIMTLIAPDRTEISAPPRPPPLYRIGRVRPSTHQTNRRIYLVRYHTYRTPQDALRNEVH